MTNNKATNESLIEVQFRLEHEMTRRGAERYLRNIEKSVLSEREDGRACGQTILSHRLDKPGRFTRLYFPQKKAPHLRGFF
jgi:hypothetical protein